MDLENLINEKKFDEALQLIAKDAEMASAIKNYNIAFLKFKQEDFVSSRLFLEKAQKLGLFSQDVNDALKVVKTKLGIEAVESSYYKEDSFMFNMVGFPQDVYFATIGIFLLMSLLTYSKAKYFMGTLALILCIGVSSFYYVIQDHKIKINKDEVSVYGGPSKIFEHSQTLYSGMKVITTIETKDWTYIKYPLAFRGWVYKHEAIEL